MKRILFVSFLDFKEKSIQVIRKTPEAYRDRQWDVQYLVARDNSRHDNYIYEREINPTGINVQRYVLPLNKLIDKVSNRYVIRILNKLRYGLNILIFSRKIQKIYKEFPFDILYGYEFHGVLACKLALLNRKLKGVKLVSRFQGTFFYEYFQTKKYIKILANLDHLLALYQKSDLCIMTNDGTQGDKALDIIKSRNRSNMMFLVNGVSEFPMAKDIGRKIRTTIRIITVSRIVRWKRLDRIISICSKLLELEFINFKVTMIGDGPDKKKIQQLINSHKLSEYVEMVGAVSHSEINKKLNEADVFMSFYDSSNVGNPLLEAIRANKIIFTLNNGDTGEWINHRGNGFIYNPEQGFEQKVVRDLIDLFNNPELVLKIREGIRNTELEKIWTWEERFQYEINAVEKLL